MHWIWALEIRHDFAQRSFLCIRRLERQNPFERLADLIFPNAHRNSAPATFSQPPQAERQLIVEELLEDQADLYRAAKAVEQFKVFAFRRKMGAEQRFAARRESIS